MTILGKTMNERTNESEKWGKTTKNYYNKLKTTQQILSSNVELSGIVSKVPLIVRQKIIISFCHHILSGFYAIFRLLPLR